MKSKIFLYLFVFVSLILVFQLVNSSKVVSYQSELIATKTDKIASLTRAFEDLESAYEDDVYFSLERNQEARQYFGDRNIDSLLQQVKDKVYESNAVKDKNPLIPYTAGESKFLINKIKVLNHKWLIADFSDGTDWGEVWIKYDLRGKSIRLKALDYFLYPSD